MTTPTNLDDRLHELGRKLDRAPSLAEAVMMRLDAEPVLRKPRHRLSLAVPASLAAAIALFAAGAWVLTPGAASLTFAQVRQAVEGKKWVYLKFDSGQEEWIWVEQNIHFTRAPDGSVSSWQRDVFQEWKPGMSMIEQKTNFPDRRLDAEQLTPWSAIVVPYDRKVEGKDSTVNSLYDVRRVVDQINGRTMVRFDVYHRIDQQLKQQLWADPQTHLPAQIRRRVRPGQIAPEAADWTIGRFEFLETGPRALADLGAPPNLRYLSTHYDGVPEDVKALHGKLREMFNRWPEHWRMLSWSQERQTVLHIASSGRVPGIVTQGYTDDNRWHPSLRFRAERFSTEAASGGDTLTFPATAEQVDTWVQTQQPYRVQLMNGRPVLYDWNGQTVSLDLEPEHPRTRQERAEWRIRGIFSRYGRLDNEHAPLRGFWPTLDWGGPLDIVPSDPKLGAGLISLRRKRPEGDVVVMHFDPDHDYLCVRTDVSEIPRDASRFYRTGSFDRLAHVIELLDLAQLSTSQWHPRLRRVSYADGSVEHWRMHFEVLEHGDFPPDTFDGARLVEKTRSQGVKTEGP